MKKVLLLDTNVSSFPIYQFLVNQGYETYVIGSNSNDCLAKYTKNYINGNYSDTQFLENLIKEQRFDLIVPGCNDVSYMSAAKANKEEKFFGLDTIEATSIINNKYEFRIFGASIGISVPKMFSDIEAWSQSSSIIVKPVDAYSGRGVTVIDKPNKKSVEEAVQKAISFSVSKKYVIEEYVDGQLYSHTAFISNKKIVNDFIVIEDGTANKFTVDTSHVVYDFPKSTLRAIRKDIQKMSKKLKLVDGLIHTQFIKTKDSFRLIEITRRCPGDLYSLLIEKSTGFKHAEQYTKPFINEKIDTEKFKVTKSHILRHTMSLPTDGNVIGFGLSQNINIDLYIPLSKTGDEIKQSPFGRIGLVFIKCKTAKELEKLNQYVLNRKLYNLI
jgi:biotin carboxylase